MHVTVAIVGRPNVGKSTLFNRLVGKKLALVDDTPGVTRDRREGQASIGGLQFTLIDTAGYEDAGGDTLQARMRGQTEQAIRLADIIIFMIDARTGVTPMDHHFARVLRRANRKVTLVANKVEGRAADTGLTEAFELGFGEPVALSAEHGLGMGDLYNVIDHANEALKAEFADAGQGVDFTGELPEQDRPLIEVEVREGETPAPDTTRPMNVAIIGRPNAGKSTLINRLLGEERLLTGPEAGITRDSIMVRWQWGGRKINLVDTAGIRRRARVHEKLEKLSVADALRAIQYAETVVLLLDATQPFEKQDLQLADLVEREGRALVIAVNKWDLVTDKQQKLAALKEMCARLLPQVRGVAMVTLSGLKGKNIDRLMEAVFRNDKVWNTRLSTARLNRWLETMTRAHPPPAVTGRRVRLRYMTQAKTRPPSFIVFASRPEAIRASYLRYLVNGLRESFAMPGVPIRLWLRGGDNPYDPKKS